MSFYSGLSLRDVYERGCVTHGCKKNSQVSKSLPETPDLFTVPATIDISQNFLGPRGLRPLFEVIRICSELRLLDLSDQQLTNESVTELCKVIKNHPSLVQLNLSKNPITIAGGLELVEMLKENRAIEVLQLDQTDVKPMVLNLIKVELDRNKASKRPVAAEKVPSADGTNDSAIEAAANLSITSTASPREIDEQAVRAAFAAIKAEVSHKLLDEDPTRAITRLCSDFSCVYRDPQFPAHSLKSIQLTEANEYFTARKWKRLSELVAGEVTGDMFSGYDGEVAFPTECRKGFEWQWTALQACLGKNAFTHNSIRALISPRTINPLGFYTVRVFVDSEWRYVVIDDYLPVDADDSRLAFTKPPASSPNAFWACLYEKACAKLAGSYQALDATVPQSIKHVLEKPVAPSTLMKDVTGGVGVSRNIQHQQFDSREWWQTLLTLSEGSTNAAMVAVSSDDEGRCSPSGILPSHCYNVLQIRQINGFSLLQLKSTFATQVKYSDNWHDTCKSWADYPLIADALGIASKADNSFWIPYHRFLHLFRSMHICRMFPNTNTRALQQVWTKTTSGGPFFGNYWGSNPHFKLTVTDNSNVFIHLALCDQRFKEAEQVETLGFHLVRCRDYPLEFHADEVVAKTEYVITNSVSYEGSLPKGDYWLVPSSYTPGKTSSFWIRVFSSAPMVLGYEQEGRHWTQRALTCDIASSGEYQNGEDNAQIELRIPSTLSGLTTIKAAILLELTETSNDTNLIVFFVRPNNFTASEALQMQAHSDGPRRFVGAIPDSRVVAKSAYIVGDRVCLETTIEVPEAQQYAEQRFYIIPCITPQKTSAKANVTVFLSEPKFSLEVLPLWPRRSVTCEWKDSAPYQRLTAGNPQIELCPHDADPYFIIHMEVHGVADPLISFSVVANDDKMGTALPCDVSDITNTTADEGSAGFNLTSAKLPEGRTLAKSAYIRHTCVTLELRLPKEVRLKSYVIVPYLQPAGTQGTCVLTVSNKSGGFAVRNLLA